MNRLHVHRYLWLLTLILKFDVNIRVLFKILKKFDIKQFKFFFKSKVLSLRLTWHDEKTLLVHKLKIFPNIVCFSKPLAILGLNERVR